MDKEVHFIQYAITSTSFNIFGEGIYNKCIRATSYTQSKGPGRDKLAFSIQIFLLSGKLEMFLIDVIGISTLCLYIFRKISSITEIEHSIPYPWK